MKKLLIALGCISTLTTLTACNAGTSNNDDGESTESVVHILAFNPYKIDNAKIGQAYTANLFLTNYATMDNPKFVVNFSVYPESAAIVLTPNCFIQAPEYNCNIQVEKLIDESGIVITPIVPDQYNYIKLGELTIN